MMRNVRLKSLIAKGYSGASMAGPDIMEATGPRGGICRHFGDTKDDLALEAFDYAVGLVELEFVINALKDKRDTIDRFTVVIICRLPDG